MGVPGVSVVDDHVRVAHRTDRQRVLDRPSPPALDVILHEAALRMEFGGAAVARRQLEHLLLMSERETVTLRVIPFKAGGLPGAGQSVVYAEAAVPRLDTVELGAWRSRRTPRMTSSTPWSTTSRRAAMTDVNWEEPFCGEGANSGTSRPARRTISCSPPGINPAQTH